MENASKLLSPTPVENEVHATPTKVAVKELANATMMNPRADTTTVKNKRKLRNRFDILERRIFYFS